MAHINEFYSLMVKKEALFFSGGLLLCPLSAKFFPQIYLRWEKDHLCNECSASSSSLLLFFLLIIIFVMAVCNFLGGQWEEVGGLNLTNRPCQLVPLVVGIFEIH